MAVSVLRLRTVKPQSRTHDGRAVVAKNVANVLSADDIYYLYVICIWIDIPVPCRASTPMPLKMRHLVAKNGSYAHIAQLQRRPYYAWACAMRARRRVLICIFFIMYV